MDSAGVQALCDCGGRPEDGRRTLAIQITDRHPWNPSPATATALAGLANKPSFQPAATKSSPNRSCGRCAESDRPATFSVIGQSEHEVCMRQGPLLNGRPFPFGVMC